MAKISMSQAKQTMIRAWQGAQVPVFAGSKVVDESHSNIVVLMCEEENFGSNLRRALGFGTYYGSIAFMYNVAENFLVCDIYFSQNTKSVAQLNQNKINVERYMGFECFVSKSTYPTVHISKIINPDNFAAEVDAMFIAASSIITN